MTDYEKTIKRLLYYANTTEDSLVKSVFHDAISLIESQRKEINLLSGQRKKNNDSQGFKVHPSCV